VAPLINDLILSGRLIRLFRHLELQNMSIISDFIHRDRMLWKKSVEQQEEESTSIEYDVSVISDMLQQIEIYTNMLE